MSRQGGQGLGVRAGQGGKAKVRERDPRHGEPWISGFSGQGAGGLQRRAQGLQGGGLLRALVLLLACFLIKIPV